jgi:hypothetical protein
MHVRFYMHRIERSRGQSISIPGANISKCNLSGRVCENTQARFPRDCTISSRPVAEEAKSTSLLQAACRNAFSMHSSQRTHKWLGSRQPLPYSPQLRCDNRLLCRSNRVQAMLRGATVEIPSPCGVAADLGRSRQSTLIGRLPFLISRRSFLPHHNHDNPCNALSTPRAGSPDIPSLP